MKHNPQGITTAMQLYFSGESLRSTARSIKLIGMDVSSSNHLQLDREIHFPHGQVSWRK